MSILRIWIVSWRCLYFGLEEEYWLSVLFYRLFVGIYSEQWVKCVKKCLGQITEENSRGEREKKGGRGFLFTSLFWKSEKTRCEKNVSDYFLIFCAFFKAVFLSLNSNFFSKRCLSHFSEIRIVRFEAYLTNWSPFRFNFELFLKKHFAMLDAF